MSCWSFKFFKNELVGMVAYGEEEEIWIKILQLKSHKASWGRFIEALKLL